MNEKYSINGTIKWYKKYHNTDLVIKTKNRQFDLNITLKALPHLMGLHYLYSKDNKEKISSYQLIQMVKNKPDEKIFAMIKAKNPDRLEDVKARVKNLKYFFENLDKAIVYDQTAPNTKIQSTFLLVKLEEKAYLQLGINKTEYEDYMETFIVQNDDYYIRNSKIKEKIISIEKYNKNLELVPFSFKKQVEVKQIEPKVKKKQKRQGLTL